MNRRTLVAAVAGTPLAASAITVKGQGPSRTQDATPAGMLPMLDPARTALVVMDYQTAWIETLTRWDTNALLDRTAGAIAMARERGVPVVSTWVAFTPADYGAVPEHNVIFHQLASMPGGLDEGDPRIAIDARVTPRPEDKVIRKTRVSAFQRTDLDGWLRGMGIDTLILAGISTSGVVLSTVCDGADLDYRLLVLSDGCADTDPAIHDVLMGKVFPQRAEVISSADIPTLVSQTT
jgi:nicotinamidase-related amidase